MPHCLFDYTAPAGRSFPSTGNKNVLAVLHFVMARHPNGASVGRLLPMAVIPGPTAIRLNGPCATDHEIRGPGGGVCPLIRTAGGGGSTNTSSEGGGAGGGGVEQPAMSSAVAVKLNDVSSIFFIFNFLLRRTFSDHHPASAWGHPPCQCRIAAAFIAFIILQGSAPCSDRLNSLRRATGLKGGFPRGKDGIRAILLPGNAQNALRCVGTLQDASALGAN